MTLLDRQLGAAAPMPPLMRSSRCRIRAATAPSSRPPLPQVLSFKWLSLTDLKVVVPLNARQSTLVAAWKAADVQAKWAASAWGKKLAARAAKASMTDFDRFEAKVAKQAIAKKIGGGAVKAKKAVKA